MAGHSKWANIRRHKEKQDAKRGKLYTKLIREITVAARLQGGDPNANPRLRAALDKAFEANMGKDVVERAIKRGAGGADGEQVEEIRYEGYGPNGVAIIVDCMTNNRNRTVSEVRHAFTKHGGNLASSNAVAYLFKHLGQLIFAPDETVTRLMEVALELPIEDITQHEDGSVEVITSPENFLTVKQALLAQGFKPAQSEVTLIAETTVTLSDPEIAQKLENLVDVLEDLEDVQTVYTNAT